MSKRRSDPRLQPAQTGVKITEHRGTFGKYVRVSFPTGTVHSVAVDENTVNVTALPNGIDDLVRKLLRDRGYQTVMEPHGEQNGNQRGFDASK